MKEMSISSKDEYILKNKDGEGSALELMPVLTRKNTDKLCDLINEADGEDVHLRTVLTKKDIKDLLKYIGDGSQGIEIVLKIRT